MRIVIFAVLLSVANTVLGHAYTNLAGNVVSGVPASIVSQTVTLTNGAEKAVYKLAIFPEGEKRRIAADAGSTQFVPANIRLALEGVNKAVRRSQQRAEKGHCTKEQSQAFCVREAERMKAYLDHEVAEGRLLPSERALLAK